MDSITRAPIHSLTFNSPIEAGLRSLCVLTCSHPQGQSLQRLSIFDYLLVHSDDAPDGPAGLHPKTPQRGNEILVRREAIRNGIQLYQSKGLISYEYINTGIIYIATDTAASFLDSLNSQYTLSLRSRAEWVVGLFQHLTDNEIPAWVTNNIKQWGGEFDMESILWAEDAT